MSASRRVRWLGGSLLLFSLAVAGSCCVLGWLLARPVPVAIGPAPADLQASEVAFPSDSGAIIHGWWCPVPHSRGNVLLLPGIRANRLSMVERARFLRAHSYATLLIDLQATGESKGEHITFGAQESRDVLAAVNFIRQRTPEPRVAIIGMSLGGAAALLAMPPLRVEGLILESVFPTIDQALDNRLRKYLGPMGRALAPLLRAQLQPRLHVSPEALRPIDHVGKVGCPLLVMNGERDRNTTVADTQQLFSQAPEPKELWIVPKAGHVDLYRAAPSAYEARVLEFLQRAFRTQSRNSGAHSLSRRPRKALPRRPLPVYTSRSLDCARDDIRAATFP